MAIQVVANIIDKGTYLPNDFGEKIILLNKIKINFILVYQTVKINKKH